MAGGFSEDWYRDHQQRVAAMRARPRLVDRDAAAVRLDVVGAPGQGRVNLETRVEAAPAPIEAKAEKKSTRQRLEDELQKQVAGFLDWALPAGFRWLHVPNGGRRDPVVAAILKGFGVKPGAADVLILTPAGRFVWIELKSPTGQLSSEQQDWRDWCRAIGAPWFLCRSLDDVVEALTSLQIRLRVRA
jgi:hypothetical protein